MSEEQAKTDQPQQPSPEQVAEAYYECANGAGALMGSAVSMVARMGPISDSPHFRCLIGGGMIATALTEAAKRDPDGAAKVYDEMLSGLIELGDRLGFNSEPDKG